MKSFPAIQRPGILVSILSCILATHSAHANDTFTRFGDHAANLLPLTAFGATFLNTRYGPSWGVSAYGVAGLVGLSRVLSDNHFMDDVFAGASVSLFFHWVSSNPHIIQLELALFETRNSFVAPADLDPRRYLGQIRRACSDIVPPL